MKTLIRRFLRAESGAVTVDFVALTAAIVVIGIGTGAFVLQGGADIGDAMNTQLTSAGTDLGTNVELTAPPVGGSN